MKTNIFIIIISSVLILEGCQNDPSKTHSSQDSITKHSDHEMMGVMNHMMQNMHQQMTTGNIDVDFARMMKSHHEGAIDMAKIEIKFGNDDMLKQMAKKIIDSQKSEIKDFDTFIDAHKNALQNYDPARKDTGFAKVLDKSMLMMIGIPKADKNSSVDQQFVTMMIPHHQSAVYMAQGFIRDGKDSTLISMARKMIDDQMKEIEQLKSWVEKN